jgi:hypothetical protein
MKYRIIIRHFLCDIFDSLWNFVFATFRSGMCTAHTLYPKQNVQVQKKNHRMKTGVSHIRVLVATALLAFWDTFIVSMHVVFCHGFNARMSLDSLSLIFIMV